MKKGGNLTGVSRMIIKYKKLRFNAEDLWKKEMRAKEAYNLEKRLRQNKEAEAEKVIEAIRLLYGIDKKTEYRLLDSPTSSLVSCKMDSNPLFVSKLDDLNLSKKATDRLKDWQKVFFIGDLVQKTGMELAIEFGHGRASVEGINEAFKIKSALDSIGLHLGIEITDWVRPPRQENQKEINVEEKNQFPTSTCL
ncbi:MAG: hypothetical protein COV32_03270 [Candidatus Yonathbacteria bacterium CG10_big_fil_rev_8_21_14_0_10_43_136]|uniref:Uncharacterized protein n=2 Tax=Parcubacteria group TaxID=1794811 RepID=A0A2M7Q5H1_9BACT|nr:MAG: hypothetical protein AUK15_01580 [Candidatus Nomurabacteria bacterium CG2_30_43_9]PIQ35520.1 MAG: hypothetical protein COW60_03550 [Candidatus Yonathbacteria bacterium CG17_big_fil_post_rev_8_21_14_2_50_43_9]PIR40380.1 MAG: hypothetical protein COV32_03270 [Candidatus Yonathbacteria bacterium CG10_big_fil_rev_8_21_14_0_10_43_136]PIX57510.1 MAG: hypothetical protein COZ48_00345 [Candidatus Yonathbacteria bacterium CG_4_10_14_3_um_filter_43_12]PIY58204.1 MAG: hypothetical protein COY98_03